jgi:hypothetical protein
VFTPDEPPKPRANRLADRGLDPKKARAWAIANDIEVPQRGPLSVAAMDAYIAAVDAGAVEPGLTSDASGSSTIQEGRKTGNEVPLDDQQEVEGAGEPAGPDVADVASSPLQSDAALVWRVACAVGRTCTWCRERQPDRATAIKRGHAHIAAKHADVIWEFRVQGIRPATAAGPGEVVEDEAVAAPPSVAAEIADMLGSSPANFVESIGDAVQLLAGAITPEDLVAILTSVDRTLWLLVEAHGRMPS